MKTVSFKNPNIFSPQIEAIVFVVLQIFLKKGRLILETYSENYLSRLSNSVGIQNISIISIKNVHFYLTEQFFRYKN